MSYEEVDVKEVGRSNYKGLYEEAMVRIKDLDHTADSFAKELAFLRATAAMLERTNERLWTLVLSDNSLSGMAP